MLENRSLLSKSGKSRIDEADLPVHSARVLQLWGELLEKAREIEDELQKTIEEERQQMKAAQSLSLCQT